MPDSSGLLSEDDRQKVAKYLEEHKAIMACGGCGQTGPWALQTHVFTMSSWHQGGLFQGSFSLPVIVLLCRHCAFVRMHSAVLMGLIARPEEKATPEVVNG